MINITFNPDKLELTITGHAGAAENGKDIVCSAVSILAYTLARAIDESKDTLEDVPVIEIDEGNVKISCTPKKVFLETIQRTYWTVLCGFEMLASSYSEYIYFIIDDTKEKHHGNN